MTWMLWMGWALASEVSVDETNVEPPPQVEPYRHPTTRRNVGVGLTTLGGGLLLGGGALMVSGAVSMGTCGPGRPDCNTGNAYQVVGGGALAVLSTPFLGVGIPLTVSGQRRLQKSRSLSVTATPQTLGIAGTW